MSQKAPSRFSLGLIVNPYAGLGGPAGLKGSDHPDTRRIAKERGVQSLVYDRVGEMLAALSELNIDIEIHTASGAMGELACSDWPATKTHIEFQCPDVTSAEDTYSAAKAIQEKNVDLLVFAGGDGTARDIYRAVGENQAVLGLPAGVKMHSGVFAVTPKAVVSVIQSLVNGRLVAARLAEVRDIDEAAFSQGLVRTQHYGEMLVPDDQLLVQSVKCSGMLDDEIMLEELCAFVAEDVDDETLYVLGSGGTLKRIKETLGMAEPTLLGVDLWYRGELLAKDVHESQLFDIVQQYPSVKLILSVIGGQGIVLGRGNQQISPRVIERVGVDNIQFVSTQQKILALEGNPLCVDTGSDELNKKLSGFHKILCGYEDSVLYEVRYI